MFELVLLFFSVFAGLLGSLLGLGGGIIIVPVLTLLFHVNIRYAIAASLVSVVATSSGAAAGFLKDHLTNVRLAVLLEVGTVLGAVCGFLISSYIHTSFLFLLFGVFLCFSAVMMLRRHEGHGEGHEHPWARKLNLGSTAPDESGRPAPYTVANLPLGWALMWGAGVLSALLGIGSGIFKVMAMDGLMRLPMKVSSATSNFMIGVTATASAAAYFVRGDVHPELTAPVAMGILIGSWIGARLMVKMPALWIRRIFVVVLVVVSIQMILRGLQ